MIGAMKDRFAGLWTQDPALQGPERARETLLLLALLLAATIPLLVVTLPPMTDILGHMGRYTVQTRIAQNPFFQQYFSFKWQIIGNLGADVLMQMIAPLVGVEMAMRIILVGTQLLGALGMMLLSRQLHGRISPFAILALPLLYSYPFTYGFINFAISMSLALLAFSLWLRLSQPHLFLLRQLLFVPIGLIIWFTHVFGWGFLGLLCGSAALVEGIRKQRKPAAIVGQTIWSCLPLLAPLVPMLLWRSGSEGAENIGWFKWYSKRLWLLSPLRVQSKIVDQLSALFLYGVVAAAGVAAMLRVRLSINPVLTLTAGFCLILFILLPERLFGSSYADMRMVPYMLALALIGINANRLSPRLRTSLLIVGLIFFAGRQVLVAKAYVQRERILNEQLEALQAIPEGARLATMVSLPCNYEWEMPWLTHIGSMALMRRHAFANDQWDFAGANLLTVHFPAAGKYAKDPSEMVFPDRCHELGYRISDRFPEFPVAAFTHLWVVGVDPATLPRRADLKPIWSRVDAVLYEVQPARPKG